MDPTKAVAESKTKADNILDVLLGMQERNPNLQLLITTDNIKAIILVSIMLLFNLFTNFFMCKVI